LDLFTILVGPDLMSVVVCSIHAVSVYVIDGDSVLTGCWRWSPHIPCVVSYHLSISVVGHVPDPTPLSGWCDSLEPIEQETKSRIDHFALTVIDAILEVGFPPEINVPLPLCAGCPKVRPDESSRLSE
jgi:hypothetical protein